jgi:hypothetical protein
MKLTIKSIGGGEVIADFETNDSFNKVVESIAQSKFFVVNFENGKCAIYVPNITHIVHKNT